MEIITFNQCVLMNSDTNLKDLLIQFLEPSAWNVYLLGLGKGHVWTMSEPYLA